MKNAVCMLAVAGLVGAAGAQNFSLSIAGAPATIDNSSGAVTITIDIIGDADVGTHMLGGAFAIEATGAILSTGMTWNPAGWSSFNTDGGYAGNGSYNQVIFGQLVIPGVPPFDVPATGSELGNAIGSFQIVIGQGLYGLMHLNFIAQEPFTLEVLDLAAGESYRSSAGNLTLNGVEILIYPTPSSLALLGLGGLAASRRRR